MLGHSLNLSANECPGTNAVLHGVASKIATVALVRVLYSAEWAVVILQCYDSQMCQGSFGLLVSFAFGIHRRVDLYSFVSFILGCAFDSTLCESAYHFSAETDWSFVNGVSRWFPRAHWSLCAGTGRLDCSATEEKCKGGVRCQLTEWFTCLRLGSIFCRLLQPGER